MDIVQLPSMPYLDSFDKFIQHETKYHNPKLNYPCYHCYGQGKIVAPGELPDVIEGHKLSKRIICLKCVDGDMSREKYLEWYNEKKKTFDSWYQECYDRYILQKSAVLKAVFALTPLEREAIGITQEVIKEFLDCDD